MTTSVARPTGPTKDERIAHFFLTGYSLDVISELGPSAGWTRQDARRVAEANGWPLDGSGRIPPSLRPAAGQHPSPAIRPGPPPTRPAPPTQHPVVALPSWAAALMEGRRHPVPRIKKLADRIDAQLANLVSAMEEVDGERKVRERLAELEAERDQLRAQLGKKPRSSTPTTPTGTPRAAPDPDGRPPIEHGTWGGFLAESRRNLDHCDACTAAKDDVMAKRTEWDGA